MTAKDMVLFFLQRATKSIKELEGTLENQQCASLPSVVRQLQGKTTHLSAFKHRGWLFHQSTEAR